MDLSQLTERQHEIYSFIRSKIEDRGYGPTVREIGEEFRINSPNGVLCHLRALELTGVIKREGFSARALKVVDQAFNLRIAERENQELRGLLAQCKDYAEAWLAENTELQGQCEAKDRVISDLRGLVTNQGEEIAELQGKVINLSDKLGSYQAENEDLRTRKRCPDCQRDRRDWAS